MDKFTLHFCTYYYLVWVALGDCPTYEEYSAHAHVLDGLDDVLPTIIDTGTYCDLVNICED